MKRLKAPGNERRGEERGKTDGLKGRQIKAERNQLWGGVPEGKSQKLNNSRVKVVVLSSESSTSGEITREAQLQVI